MSGHRAHIGSKPAREIFLTSSSLSFSSLSSSVSWDDAIELNTNEFKTSYKDNSSQQDGEVSNASSQGSGMSGVTHVTMQPPRLQPVPSMNKGLGNYNPERIPASVFGKTADMNWSEISNDSLFSLKFDGYRKSNAHASRQSNIKPEEVLMSGEYLRYTPSLLVKPGDAKEKISQVKEIQSGETRAESHSHQEKPSATPDVSWSANPNNFYGLDQAPQTKVQSFPLPDGDKKSKKRKKTRKSKKKKKKEKKEKNKKKEKKEKKEKKKKKCCMWSWLCSIFSKCECDLHCYKWRKCGCCCRGPKTMVL